MMAMMPECKEFCESWRSCTGCFDCEFRDDCVEQDDIPDEVLDALIAEDQKNEMEKGYRGPEE